MADNTSTGVAARGVDDQVKNVFIRPTVNPSFKASGSSAADAQSGKGSGHPAPLKPPSEDPPEVVSESGDSQPASGNRYQFNTADFKPIDIGDHEHSPGQVAPAPASSASDELPQVADSKKGPEPNTSTNGGHKDSHAGGSKGDEHANIDEMLEKAVFTEKELERLSF